MTGNTESPMCRTVTGSAVLARSWFGQIRSAFGRPHTALMGDTREPAAISHPSISHFGQEPDFIRTLQVGDSFGELGVLYDVPRTATVRCIEPGHILRIPGQTFLDARYRELNAATMGGWTKQPCAD